ncbi:hypothetical protein C8R44DRAFT_874994 [Mycena epipterygia]|nr:hypothetical protein C8R44DRAFT_874994 [Mycena epipterygia]
MSQPRTISYALVVPALVLDLFVIAIMGYAASGAVQDKVYTNGGGIIGPLIGLIVAGLETLYLTIALLLTAATVAVPALAAILVDSLLIPCYPRRRPRARAQHQLGLPRAPGRDVRSAHFERRQRVACLRRAADPRDGVEVSRASVSSDRSGAGNSHSASCKVDEERGILRPYLTVTLYTTRCLAVYDECQEYCMIINS